MPRATCRVLCHWLRLNAMAGVCACVRGTTWRFALSFCILLSRRGYLLFNALFKQHTQKSTTRTARAREFRTCYIKFEVRRRHVRYYRILILKEKEGRNPRSHSAQRSLQAHAGYTPLNSVLRPNLILRGALPCRHPSAAFCVGGAGWIGCSHGVQDLVVHLRPWHPKAPSHDVRAVDTAIALR